jgi:hypothetical protein
MLAKVSAVLAVCGLASARLGAPEVLRTDPDIIQSQRVALTNFYRSTNGTLRCSPRYGQVVPHLHVLPFSYRFAGDNWKRNDGWLVNADYCGWSTATPTKGWYGIECLLNEEAQTIIALRLPNNGLTGHLPAEISGLVMLKELMLQNNLIEGELPDSMSLLNQLMNLNLGYNMITGTLPPNLWDMQYPWPTIKEINLENNMLTGEIPPSLWGPEELPIFHADNNLQVLNLQYNSFSGIITPRIVRSDKLTTLLLGYNQLTASLASSEMADYLVHPIRKYCDISGNHIPCPVRADVADNCQVTCEAGAQFATEKALVAAAAPVADDTLYMIQFTDPSSPLGKQHCDQLIVPGGKTSLFWADRGWKYTIPPWVENAHCDRVKFNYVNWDKYDLDGYAGVEMHEYGIEMPICYDEYGYEIECPLSQ